MMSAKTAYDAEFYQGLQEETLDSAAEVVPFVMELLHPTSVVDVGCGTGAWLSVFRDCGVEEIIGIEGDWVDPDRMLIPSDNLVMADLQDKFDLGRSFDLAICLEVGEHLEPYCAEHLVTGLTSMASVVLFSAAIPFQGGVDHLNEQWPGYWSVLFDRVGFSTVDCLRPELWSRQGVAYYYRQNLLLFVAHERMNALRRAKGPVLGKTFAPASSVVHPELFQKVVRERDEIRNCLSCLGSDYRSMMELASGTVALSKVLRALPRLCIHAIKRRLSATDRV